MEISGHGKIKTNTIALNGSVEAAYPPGLLIAILILLASSGFTFALMVNLLTLVESRETMKAAGLKAIDTVVESSAIVIKSRSPDDQNLVHLIAVRIRGAIIAQRFVLCSYNIERRSQAAATQFSPLQGNGLPQ